MSFQIAIDGPAGAGKSTIAKLVSRQLRFVYVDTGAMYRAMALYFVRKGTNKEDQETIEKECERVHISIQYDNGEQIVLLNGENVNGLIRTNEIGDMASAISVYAGVRKKLVMLQQELSKKTSVVMDGRDIASCVLPNADAKIYLTAQVAVRANRRYKELIDKGISANLKDIEQEIEERDYRDTHRQNSPLVQVEDAILIDTSYMTIEGVSKEILQVFRSCLEKRKVITTENAGFCFGANRGVESLNEALKDGVPVYTYGPILNNDKVVEHYAKLGVIVIDHPEELKKLPKGKVLIRSHGVGKKIYEELNDSNYEIIDATCPFVKRIHAIVEEQSMKGAQIVVIGNPLHPEVEGIVGWSQTEATVIENADEIANFHPKQGQEICIVSQTTFNNNKFKELVEIFCKNSYNINVMNTICDATSIRQREADEISRLVDVMLVIGDTKSSNSRKLYEICKANCEQTYFIQTIDDLQQKLPHDGLIGITAGASTPKYIIEEVQNYVRINF